MMIMKTILLFLMLSPLIASSQWTQVGVDVDGEAPGDFFGLTSAISGDGAIMAVGSVFNDDGGSDSGSVRVYENMSGTWTQIGSDINGVVANDWFGYSIDLNFDGSILAIGAPFNDVNGNNSGHVKMFINIAGTWVQRGPTILGEGNGDSAGYSVGLSDDGNRIAIGARGDDDNGTDSGHVRIYQFTTGADRLPVWTQIGQDIDGESSGDASGHTLCLSADGTIVAIGSPRSSSDTGQVRIYKFISTAWTQIGQDINGETTGDWSGYSMSLSTDGSIVAIGAPFNSPGNKGSVRVYEDMSGVWTQIGVDIDGESSADESGSSVSLSADGSVLAVGARRNDGNGSSSGHTRIYQNMSGSWIQIGLDIDGESFGDFSGDSVSLSSNGSIVVIGASGNNGVNGSDSGHVRVFENPTLGVSEFSIQLSLQLYPNPTTGGFSIDSNQEINNVNVYDLQGKLIKSFNEDRSIYYIDEFASGIYFLDIETEHGKIVRKIVKE